MTRLAYVVSSHGFGHAARSCAVIAALWRRRPDLRIDLFGGTPDWFFAQSLGPAAERAGSSGGSYACHESDTDVGLVQTSALREDLDATLRALAPRFPLQDACRPLAEQIGAVEPDLVVCDISPWGLAAARTLGVPSVLVENFTWDWIYRGYDDPRLGPYAEALNEAFRGADLHVQTAPVCLPAAGALASSPVSRPQRSDHSTTRAALGVPDDAILVMVTMGGVAWEFDALQSFEDDPRFHWLLAGAASADSGTVERRGRLVCLPHRSPLYHPDLVQAADVVVGKLGYSTLAEIARAGARFAYVPRPEFVESQALEAWVRQHLASRRVPPDDIEAPDWAVRIRRHVDALMDAAPREPIADGAGTVAQSILELL